MCKYCLCNEINDLHVLNHVLIECPAKEQTNFHLFGTPSKLTVEVKNIDFLERLLDWNNTTMKYESKTSYTLTFESSTHRFSKEFASSDIKDEQLSFKIDHKKSTQYKVGIKYNFLNSGKEIVCTIHETLDTSVVNCGENNLSSTLVSIDRLCDGVVHCNNTGYDESKKLCQGSNELYTYSLWTSTAIIIIFGFVIVLYSYKKRKHLNNLVKSPIDLPKIPVREIEADVTMASFILTSCNDPKAITPEKTIRADIKQKLRQFYSPCQQDVSNRELIQFVYSLSLCKDKTKICNLIIEEFLCMEEEKHHNKPDAFGCMLLYNKGEKEYLSAYIKQVFERKECSSVLKRKIFEFIGCLVSCNESTRYYSKVILNYIFAFVYVSFYYFDITKDFLLTYSYYHITENILVKKDTEIRFQSVGGIQLDNLAIYSVSIILLSELILVGYVWTGRHSFNKIFHIDDLSCIDGVRCFHNRCRSFWSCVISFLPIHFMLSETCMASNKILMLTRELESLLKDNKIDAIVATQALSISKKIDQSNTQLYHINKLYRKVQLMESYTERQYQTVLLTTLMIFSAPYPRIKILFDGVLSDRYWLFVSLNWCITMFGLVNSIIQFKDSRRFPVTPGILGKGIQILVVAALAVARVWLIAICLGNVPYYHPMGAIIQFGLICVLNKVLFKKSISVRATILPSLLPCFLKPPKIQTNDHNILKHLKGHGGIIITMIYEAVTTAVFGVIGYVVRLPGVANDIDVDLVASNVLSNKSTPSRRILMFERYVKQFNFGEIFGYWILFLLIHFLLLVMYYAAGHPYKVVLTNKGRKENEKLPVSATDEGNFL